MSVLDALILGFIQGLTEFLPVSSSGHLLITAKALGLNGNTFSFDVLLHFGTLAALVIYFRSDLLAFVAHARSQRRLLTAIVITTIPAVLAGLLLQGFIETHTRSVWLVVVTLTTFGAIMLRADGWQAKRQLANVTKADALFIGLAQVLALIPGVSRSGSTILAARARHFDYQAATRVSFLIAIPVTVGAALKVFVSDSGTNLLAESPGLVLAGNLAAAISGLIAISFMLKMIQRIGLKWFGVYRLGLALLLSLLLITGVL